MLKINYNFQSDFTHANLLRTEYSLNKSMEKLATGYRINKAADDAAGLFIADQLKAYARSLEQGSKNAQDGISIAQIAQGALSEVYNILNDIKSKTIQASNTLDDNSREAVQQDINKLVDVISKIFSDTEFNGMKLFDSTSEKTFKIHYGGRKEQQLEIKSSIAKATAGTDGTKSSEVVIGTTTYTIDVTSEDAANTSVQTVDDLIKAIDKEASKFGSAQIELEKIISNNETQKVNTLDAESRIRDVDFAKEMANYTKYNILMQSGSAILAQANQQAQLVLQLLR